MARRWRSFPQAGVPTKRVLTLYRDFSPDLLLVDLHMPGLDGNDVLRQIACRIVAVADVYDAVTNRRPYKEPWTTDEAVTWMESMRARKVRSRRARCTAARSS
jgi:response regulator RpfG family c-di-GMP phosphodiesterase